MSLVRLDQEKSPTAPTGMKPRIFNSTRGRLNHKQTRLSNPGSSALHEDASITSKQGGQTPDLQLYTRTPQSQANKAVKPRIFRSTGGRLNHKQTRRSNPGSSALQEDASITSKQGGQTPDLPLYRRTPQSQANKAVLQLRCLQHSWVMFTTLHSVSRNTIETFVRRVGPVSWDFLSRLFCLFCFFLSSVCVCVRVRVCVCVCVLAFFCL